jgi:hypothetical protein
MSGPNSTTGQVRFEFFIKSFHNWKHDEIILLETNRLNSDALSYSFHPP